MTKVSVITVALNSAKTIAETVQSIAWQTHIDIEYIVIDGLSTDGTMNILRSLESHIDILASERDGGIYDAMNKGIKKANGEVIVFLNADDIMLPRGIELAVAAMDANDLDFYFGGTLFSGGLVSGYRPHRLYLGLDYIASAHSGSFFVRRKVHDEIGLYDGKFKTSADYDFFLRMISRGYVGGGARANEITSVFRPGGFSSKQRYSDKKIQEILIRKNNGQSLFKITIFLFASVPPQLFMRTLRFIAKLILRSA